MTVTVDSFLAGVKRRITVPANQVLLDDPDILAMGDDCVKEALVPLLLGVNQNYFAVYKDVPLVANQAEYDIPDRAMGRALRDIKLVANADTSQINDLSLIALEDAHLFAKTGKPTGFYFLGDVVVTVPAPVSADYSLRMYHNQAPSKMVGTTTAARVVSFSGTSVVCSGSGSGLLTGTSIDFVRGKSGCRTLGIDKTITSIAGSTFDFALADIPTNLQAGDYIVAAGCSPVLQIPDEAVPYLEACLGERICGAIGDIEGAGLLAGKMPTVMKAVLKVLSPRVEGETTKIVNRGGLLRGKGWNFWRARGGFYS